MTETNNSKTNIEYFNEYMKMFVSEIRTIFPEFNEIIDDYYKELLKRILATMINTLSVL